MLPPSECCSPPDFSGFCLFWELTAASPSKQGVACICAALPAPASYIHGIPTDAWVWFCFVDINSCWCRILIWDFHNRCVILTIIWFICLPDFCWLGNLLEERGKVQTSLFAPLPVANKCRCSDRSHQVEASRHCPRKMGWPYFMSPNLICRN